MGEGIFWRSCSTHAFSLLNAIASAYVCRTGLLLEWLGSGNLSSVNVDEVETWGSVEQSPPLHTLTPFMLAALGRKILQCSKPKRIGTS
jgi:hypothetical protein